MPVTVAVYCCVTAEVIGADWGWTAIAIGPVELLTPRFVPEPRAGGVSGLARGWYRQVAGQDCQSYAADDEQDGRNKGDGFQHF